jgi:hypothetical protein
MHRNYRGQQVAARQEATAYRATFLEQQAPMHRRLRSGASIVPCLKKGDAMLRMTRFKLDEAEPHEGVHHLTLDRKYGQARRGPRGCASHCSGKAIPLLCERAHSLAEQWTDRADAKSAEAIDVKREVPAEYGPTAWVIMLGLD